LDPCFFWKIKKVIFLSRKENPRKKFQEIQKIPLCFLIVERKEENPKILEIPSFSLSSFKIYIKKGFKGRC
jgi:hypothetical protein